MHITFNTIVVVKMTFTTVAVPEKVIFARVPARSAIQIPPFDAPLHPPGGEFCSPVRDVHGRMTTHLSFLSLLCTGWIWKEQGRNWRLLLLDKVKTVDILHPHPCRWEVGRLAQ